MIERIISGGQVGADQGGLRAARLLGIATGGWMPRGFRTEAGPNPDLAREFGLVETPSDAYPQRTEYNVRDSDGTIRFARNWSARGEQCTLKMIRKYARPWIDVDLDRPRPPEEVRRWIAQHDIRILNVAGNKSRDLGRAAAIADFVCDYLVQILRPDDSTQPPPASIG